MTVWVVPKSIPMMNLGFVKLVSSPRVFIDG
jgi:hypothetical protein